MCSYLIFLIKELSACHQNPIVVKFEYGRKRERGVGKRLWYPCMVGSKVERAARLSWYWHVGFQRARHPRSRGRGFSFLSSPACVLSVIEPNWNLPTWLGRYAQQTLKRSPCSVSPLTTFLAEHLTFSTFYTSFYDCFPWLFHPSFLGTYRHHLKLLKGSLTLYSIHYGYALQAGSWAVPSVTLVSPRLPLPCPSPNTLQTSCIYSFLEGVFCNQGLLGVTLVSSWPAWAHTETSQHSDSSNSGCHKGDNEAMSKNTEEERAVELPFSSPQPGGLLCSHLDSWGSPHLSRAGEIAFFLREEGRKEGKWLSYISGDKSGVGNKG